MNYSQVSDYLKNHVHSLIWQKLQNFSFDENEAVVKFSDKLSFQQKWPVNFTERVIEEYRKFIFLCCISPSGAAPSQIVDEAWHLHLTNSVSYWVDLCENTLGTTVHHHPSKGGKDEVIKH